MSKMKYILCILALLLTVHSKSQDIQVRDFSLKMTGASFEKTFETITSTDTYKDVAREQILEYYHQ